MKLKKEPVSEKEEFPKGWIKSTLNDSSLVILGQSPPSFTYNHEKIGLPFFQGKGNFGRLYPTVKNWCANPKTIAEKNDILISVRAPVGPTNLSKEKCCIGRGLAAIRPFEGINYLYVFYHLHTLENKLAVMGTGTMFKAITGNQLKSLILNVAPSNEQKRIVSKIESIFTQIDAGKEKLENIKKLLGYHKQSILKSAFEGKLTSQNPNDESAEILLNKIDGDSITDLIFKKNNLPKGWIKTPIKQIALLINGKAFKPEDWSNKGLPIVRIQNLNNHNKPFNYCNFKIDEKFMINDGQLLFAWSGTPGTSFGCFIWNNGQAVLNQHIFRVEINEEYLDKQYMLYAINQNLDKYINNAHGTAGLAHITKGKFEEELIIISPLSEQKRIVSKIESIFGRIDAIEKHVESALNLLNTLKQSTLKQAFEGKLVPQDPNDESAEILLQKIKHEKEQLLKNQKPSKRNKNVK